MRFFNHFYSSITSMILILLTIIMILVIIIIIIIIIPGFMHNRREPFVVNSQNKLGSSH